MKKFLAYLLTIAMTAGVAISGTMAYLQDSDSDVNVMTLGNVKIEQHEYQRVEENGTYKTDTIDGKNSYVLEAFKQGKALLPATESTNFGAGPWDETTVRMSQVDSYGGMQVFTSKNAQDKFVTVENNGNTDAYVRTIVAIEVGTANPSLIGTSSHTTWTANEVGIINIDGNNYYVKEYVYVGGQLSDGSWRHENGVLPANDTTYPNLSQVYLKSEAANEDMVAIDGNENGTLDILVLSQAVQAEGFADAQTALDTVFGDITTENHPWTNTVMIESDSAEDLQNALNNGKNVVLTTDIVQLDVNEFDGKNATITLAGYGNGSYGYLAFLPDAGENVTVSNLNVTGTGFVEVGHYGEGGGNYEVNNLVVKDMTATLCINNGGNNIAGAFSHYGIATLTNCTMTGTVSQKDGYTEYDAAFVNGTTTFIKGGKYGKVYLAHQAHVTITDAEVDSITSCAITTRNLGKLTIAAGAKVGAIYLTPGSYTPALIIEEGSTVGAIIYKGVTYTVDQWNNR